MLKDDDPHTKIWPHCLSCSGKIPSDQHPYVTLQQLPCFTNFTAPIDLDIHAES